MRARARVEPAGPHGQKGSAGERGGRGGSNGKDGHYDRSDNKHTIGGIGGLYGGGGQCCGRRGHRGVVATQRTLHTCSRFARTRAWLRLCDRQTPCTRSVPTLPCASGCGAAEHAHGRRAHGQS